MVQSCYTIITSVQLKTVFNKVSWYENILNFRDSVLLKIITILLVNLTLLLTQ